MTTVYSDDIYNPNADPQWDGQDIVPWFSVRQEALRLEKPYARVRSTQRDNNVYSVATSAIVCSADAVQERPVVVEQPEAVTAPSGSDLLTAVMTYLASPERSDRGDVIEKLHNEEFFDASDDQERRVALRRMLNDVCEDGRSKAEEYLAPWLTSTKRTVRVVLDLTVEDVAEEISENYDGDIGDWLYALVTDHSEELDSDTTFVSVNVVSSNLKEDTV